jgi:hypothetical protein
MIELVPVTHEHCVEISETARHPGICKIEESHGKSILELIE